MTETLQPAPTRRADRTLDLAGTARPAKQLRHTAPGEPPGEFARPVAQTQTVEPGERVGAARREGRSWWGWAPVVLASVFTAVYCLISLTRFARLETPSWDNAIFEQAIRGYARLGAPIVDIKGPGFNQLGDHFSPILAVLGPVYRLFPHAQTLLVAQAVLVGLSIIPIGRAAVRLIGAAGGIAVTVAYGLSFGIQAAVNVDFHEVAFAAPLLACAGAAALRGRWWITAAWCVPLLLVKEDLGATVAAIGVVGWFAGARRPGVTLLVGGAVAWAVTVFAVIPAFNPGGGFGYWSVLGVAGPGPGAWHTFFVGWNIKAVTLLVTFGITGFLALRSPWALAAVPTLLWRFAGDRGSFWGTDWHYSLVLMPILFVAALDAVVRIRTARARPTATTAPSRRRAMLGAYAAHLPAAMLAVALALCVNLPVRSLVDPQTYRPSDRTAAANAVMALMPTGSSVETNRGLITHLTSRYHVYWFDAMGNVVPDYVLFDTTTGNDGDIVAFAERQHPGARYRLIFDQRGYLLAQRAMSAP